jgi:hypothetical protein
LAGNLLKKYGIKEKPLVPDLCLTFDSLLFYFFNLFSTFSTMDRKSMCICICVMIALGAALFVAGQALDTEIQITLPKNPTMPSKELLAMQRSAGWCLNLAKLLGVVSFLLILCCLCCKDVAFNGAGRSSRSGYE